MSLYQPWTYQDARDVIIDQYNNKFINNKNVNGTIVREITTQQGGFLTVFKNHFSFITVHYAGKYVEKFLTY